MLRVSSRCGWLPTRHRTSDSAADWPRVAGPFAEGHGVVGGDGAFVLHRKDPVEGRGAGDKRGAFLRGLSFAKTSCRSSTRVGHASRWALRSPQWATG